MQITVNFHFCVEILSASREVRAKSIASGKVRVSIPLSNVIPHFSITIESQAYFLSHILVAKEDELGALIQSYAYLQPTYNCFSTKDDPRMTLRWTKDEWRMIEGIINFRYSYA